MPATISLRRAAKCADCGADLPVGTRAKWYRNGSVYGLTCHARPANLPTRRDRAATAVDGNVLLDSDPAAFDFASYSPEGETAGCE